MTTTSTAIIYYLNNSLTLTTNIKITPTVKMLLSNTPNTLIRLLILLILLTKY